MRFARLCIDSYKFTSSSRNIREDVDNRYGFSFEDHSFRIFLGSVGNLHAC